MPINYKLAEDAKPQITLLLIATAISVGLWMIGWYLPIVGYIVYPIQLFATFVHESSHAMAALITGNSVMSLTVSPDTSGMVWSQSSGFSSLFISSAGYVGTTLFGTLLLVWMRFGLKSRLALYLCSGLIAVMTVVFGFIAPFWNFLANVTFGSMVFTVFSGAILTAGLFAVAKFATDKWVNFSLAFLAVQCLLNSFFSLKTLFVISATSDASSDAANMAAATGIPAVLWVLLWIAISVVMMAVGVRLYASRGSKAAADSLFVN
ncbi:MAG: M50 family metallopeptidase [Acidobacteria bacterium]|nr:M50 family metallopeptidase [Acidobacteriota bacterium]